MSKVVMSLPKGMVRDSVTGGLLALVTYVALQLVCALLVDKGVLGLEQLYPLVCVTAAIASFLGCGYSVLKGKGASMLTVPAVVAVFMTLTLAAALLDQKKKVALLTADTIAIENGVTGLGLSMAAGGLLAALVGGNLPKGGRKKRRARRTGQSRR